LLLHWSNCLPRADGNHPDPENHKKGQSNAASWSADQGSQDRRQACLLPAPRREQGAGCHGDGGRSENRDGYATVEVDDTQVHYILDEDMAEVTESAIEKILKEPVQVETTWIPPKDG
jgi:hypothetical protein